MRPDVYCPRPLRPPKRTCEDLDPDCPPTSKRPRLLQFPSPIPSIEDQLPEAPLLSSSRPNSASSWLKSTKKQALERCDSDYPPPNNHRRLQSPTLSPTSSVHQWLSKVPRPESAPPEVNGSKHPATTGQHIKRPSSTPAKEPMSQQDSQSFRRRSAVSSQIGKSTTSSAGYRSTLFRNGIIIDPSGRRMPKDIRDLVDTHILKARSSPELTQEELLEAKDAVEGVWDHAEPKASELIRTKAFPVKRRGIAEGGNTSWTTDPLPTNPQYPHPISTPKPDFHYGYPTGVKSDLTDPEAAVADHRVARSRTQPTRDNMQPFMAIEFKSEATGGTIWVAENQAAGSAAHIVNSLRWLLSQASPSRTHLNTDSVAFTSSVTQRTAVFHVTWWSEEERRIIMSYINDYSLMKDSDIQGCRNIVNNILDYGEDIRKPIFKKALGDLFPFPTNWKMSRSATVISDTPPTSFADEETRSNKSQHR
ncbi:MAG: hypothetical protein M1836_000026 [Candelina mexicana]|nr:MAG: hypothetical protein M1836_000026 [Candelina mexicana]